MASKHSKQSFGQVHTTLAYSYVNAAARIAAIGFTIEDLGKIALQIDTNSYWILNSITPATWIRLQTGYPFTIDKLNFGRLVDLQPI